MDLKNLTDEHLLKETERLCLEERKTLSQVLHHLREIERRRLFSSLKYPSMFEYVVKHLGYSEDQAYRRIAAMRLLRDMPELDEKIKSGSIQLAHLSMANSFFNKEKQYAQKEFSKEEKMDLLSKLSNQTARQAEKIVLSMSTSPLLHRPERERVISEEVVEINFVARLQLKDKIKKLKGLLAHKSPHLSTAELMERLCDLGLEKWGKGMFLDKTESLGQEAISVSNNSDLSWESLKKIIWRRDKGQCQNCGSSYAVEVDHILPKAKGGEDNVSNLRLLCRSCNQRSAIQHFGIKKMQRHLN